MKMAPLASRAARDVLEPVKKAASAPSAAVVIRVVLPRSRHARRLARVQRERHRLLHVPPKSSASQRSAPHRRLRPGRAQPPPHKHLKLKTKHRHGLSGLAPRSANDPSAPMLRNVNGLRVRMLRSAISAPATARVRRPPTRLRGLRLLQPHSPQLQLLRLSPGPLHPRRAQPTLSARDRISLGRRRPLLQPSSSGVLLHLQLPLHRPLRPLLRRARLPALNPLRAHRLRHNPLQRPALSPQRLLLPLRRPSRPPRAQPSRSIHHACGSMTCATSVVSEEKAIA